MFITSTWLFGPLKKVLTFMATAIFLLALVVIEPISFYQELTQPT